MFFFQDISAVAARQPLFLVIYSVPIYLFVGKALVNYLMPGVGLSKIVEGPRLRMHVKLETLGHPTL